jgi:hypothetical protein
MRPALLLCVLAMTLAACGGATPNDSAKHFKGAEHAVAATVEALESAAGKTDGAKVCTRLLAANLLASLKARAIACPAALKEAFKDADTLDLTVEHVTINGTKASAKVTSGTGSKKRTDTLGLEKVGADWRISSLTA